ncbi:hypothetical protein L3X38_035787 [Prunus dulcis]|uniref:Uncharacterized protein n=1 Tax=Prunus dulcis TaxID=3755 RepID=A0AAD4VLN5_PRUDU|nr:hypothetical protein L3X38_035787 [Prunus dulcis]
MSTIQPIIFRVNQSILGRQSGQASHIVLSCAGNFVSSGLKAKTSRKNIVEVVVVSEIVAGLYKGSSNFYCIDVVFVMRRNGQKRGTCLLVFQLAAYPPFPASNMGWGKELGQVQD